MEPDGSYLTPASSHEGEIKERGSRFRALVLVAGSEVEAQAALRAVRERYRDATHHCWAWRIGEPSSERFSDAGEPSGTAGRPILHVLRGARLSDVLVVVVRWFGGTKLGKGGLARAYSAAVKEALESLPTSKMVPSVMLLVQGPYTAIGAVKRLLRPPKVRLVDETYEGSFRLILEVDEAVRGDVEAALAVLSVVVQAGSESSRSAS